MLVLCYSKNENACFKILTAIKFFYFIFTFTVYVATIFSFISELVTSWIRIQEASDYADPCWPGSETLLKTSLIPYLFKFYFGLCPAFEIFGIFFWFASSTVSRVMKPKPSLWPSSGSTLNICLIIHANYMELNLIWCLF